MPIKLTYLNVKGLNSLHKWANLQREMTKQNADIVLIQETHFAKSKTPKIRLKGYGTVYLASGPRKKNGVFAAVQDALQFQHHYTYADPQGRYLILICTIAQSTYTLVNIYGPNSRQLCFFRHLYKKVYNLRHRNIVMVGNLNIIGYPFMDTSTKKGQHQLALNHLLHDV